MTINKNPLKFSSSLRKERASHSLTNTSCTTSLISSDELIYSLLKLYNNKIKFSPGNPYITLQVSSAENDILIKEVKEFINNIYSNYTDEKEPHETNGMTKMMTWYGVQMKTMIDDTTSKLSELLMQGTNMGIIEGRRLLNQNSDIAPDVHNILNDFVTMQEDSVETLKKYL